jgi:cadmium resistance protein CadD (predicted permease)
MTPADLLAIVTLTLAGFVATNIDNLLILVALLATGNSRWPVLAGYGAAAATVLVICLLGGALGGLLKPDWVGYLGVIPVLLGLQLGFRNWRGAPVAPTAPGGGAAGTAFVLTLSNSGDSLALFLPLLAETERESAMLLVALYLLLVLSWARLARRLAGRAGVVDLLSRHSRWLLPVVMIAVGSYVLLDTTTDTLIKG